MLCQLCLVNAFATASSAHPRSIFNFSMLTRSPKCSTSRCQEDSQSEKKTLHETVDLEELEETPDTEKPLQPSIRKSDNTNAVTPSDFPSDPEVNATTRSTVS